MVKGKAAAAAVRVPQSREEASSMIADYGMKLREVGRIEADMNDLLAEVKKEYLARATPLADEANDLLKGLQIWCEANRAQLTQCGKSKTVDLGTGKVSWRYNPAKVSLRGKAEDIIARIKDAGEAYLKFLRETVELDRVAMLRDPNLAKQIEGVRIASAGETFTVEPFAAEQLAEVAS